MKIKYTFVNGETSEIEVDENVGNFIIEMDRQEYNINHKETRRHCSLEEYDLDNNLVASNEDIETDYIQREEFCELYEAMRKLEPRQKELIFRVFFLGEKQSDIANEKGVDKSAIKHALNRAMEKIKKNLK